MRFLIWEHCAGCCVKNGLQREYVGSREKYIQRTSDGGRSRRMWSWGSRGQLWFGIRNFKSITINEGLQDAREKWNSPGECKGRWFYTSTSKQTEISLLSYISTVTSTCVLPFWRPCRDLMKVWSDSLWPSPLASPLWVATRPAFPCHSNSGTR